MKISEHVLISGIEIDLHSNFALRLKPLNLNYAPKLSNHWWDLNETGLYFVNYFETCCKQKRKSDAKKNE